MLTFFEYLRNRAYESIIAGANDAIEFLEREKLNLEESTAELVKPPRKRQAIDFQSANQEPVESAESTSVETPEGETQKSPRRRGRPPKNESSQQ